MKKTIAIAFAAVLVLSLTACHKHESAMPVGCLYDEVCMEKCAPLCKVDFDALTPAMEAGSAKSVNIVLMGHFAKHTDIPKEKWLKALEKVVKPQFLDMNLKAFDLGFNS